MHKFNIHPCRIDRDDNNNVTFIVALGSLADGIANMFFPVPEEAAMLINFVLDPENKGEISINKDTLGVYKTMLDSWKSGDKYIAGIVIDTQYDKNIDDDILEASIILIDDDGNLDSFTKTSFVHAMVVAAMVDAQITMTSELVEKIYFKDISQDDDDDSGGDDDENDGNRKPPNGNKKIFPSDQNVIRIAQSIIEGNNEEDNQDKSQ